jgi:hypothetical protein
MFASLEESGQADPMPSGKACQFSSSLQAVAAGRSSPTRLFPIDFGDHFVIKLPDDLEALIARVGRCPVCVQHSLHGPWKQVPVNAGVAIELELKYAIVQSLPRGLRLGSCRHQP